MTSKTVTITNPTGLHARPAAQFVAAAKQFESDIRLHRINEDKQVSAKSMVKLLALGICQNQTIEITAEGSDEEVAVESLAKLAESFNEQYKP